MPLKQHFGDAIDFYGRGHNFIPFKDDALMPYRFHICIENCQVNDLWTEKLADPNPRLLGSYLCWLPQYWQLL